MSAPAPHQVVMIGERGVGHAPIVAAIGGNKAANLSCLDGLGLRVPPAISLGATFCMEYLMRGVVDPAFPTLLGGYLRRLEDATGDRLGGRRPLLVSVRSSPPMSMPGMLETILNVGLSESVVRSFIRATGNPSLAWDAFLRLIRSFGQTVHGLPSDQFARFIADRLSSARVEALHELDPLALRSLARDGADLLEVSVGTGLPSDPLTQIVQAVEAVWRSWNSPRAQAYRRLNGLDPATGTGVLIQAMVFGNAGGLSGSGVGFTRDPSDGRDQLYVDFLFNSQGEDVVSGQQTRSDSERLRQWLPGVWAELEQAKPTLERALGDMQDFEFTVQDGRLFFLQTRAGKRTPWAAVQIAVDLATAGLIDSSEARRRLEGIDPAAVSRTRIPPESQGRALASGTPASPGVATGNVVFDSIRARDMAGRRPILLVRPDVSPDDIAGFDVASGVLTALGGRTSHAAVMARQMGKVCVVGCRDLLVEVDARRCTIGQRVFHEGDVMTIDGSTGLVYGERVTTVTESPVEALATLARWRGTA